MKKNIKLPFTNELKGGNKKSFKILNEEQLKNKLKKNPTILNVIKKFIYLNNQNNNSESIIYIKASDTKEYYNKLNKK
jgi:hypothetical protein